MRSAQPVAAGLNRARRIGAALIKRASLLTLRALRPPFTTSVTSTVTHSSAHGTELEAGMLAVT